MSQSAVIRQKESGFALRAASRVSPGVRQVRQQIDDFARCWAEHNEATLSGHPDADSLWVLLGDSLSQGIGASAFASAWPRRLEAELAVGDRMHSPVALVNLSTTGARAKDVTSEQLERLHDLAVVPRLLTVTVGSNDLMRSVRLRRVVKDFEVLMAALSDWVDRGSDIAVATIPDRGSLVARRFNERMRTMAAEHGVDVVEIGSRAKLGASTTAPDRFHPNDAGYEPWLRGFAAVVRTSLGH